MKCKAHPYTNPIGVCATCLRERLISLAAAQNQSSSPSPPPPDHFSLHRLSSASPAISAASRHHHLFFRTPQVGPSSAPLYEEGTIASLKKNRSRKFSLISTLFGNSKSEKEKHNSNSTKSKSWISNLVHKSRKSRSESKEINDSRQSWRDQDRERGLSPDRDYCESPNDASVSESPWRPSPSPMRRSAAGGYRRRHLAASGFTVCLSPLVRPSPAHRRSQGAEAGCSGDLRSPAHHRHVAVGGGSIGPSLCHNRSRKIADIGRLR